jgi:hypothetical protein
LAIRTSAIRPAEPANTDARAEWDILRGAADYFTDNLVAWDHARLFGWQIAFDDVQIGTANSAGAHSQENVSVPELRIWNVSDS